MVRRDGYAMVREFLGRTPAAARGGGDRPLSEKTP
jgi:hypothetical protein